MIKIKIGDFEVSNDLPFTLIAGPCVLENNEHPIKIAEVVRDLFRKTSHAEQSYSERQMFQVAIERLARE